MKEIVVITGAAAGIGKALSEVFIKSGTTVVGLDLNQEALRDFRGPSYVVDVADGAKLIRVAQKILHEIGRPTVWINNAGVVELGAFQDVAANKFDEVIAVNLNGVVYGVRAALHVMQNPESGTIVNVASMNGIIPAPFMTSYVASKHAVVGFTRALQEELLLKQSPLKVVLVIPGFVKTDMIMEQKEYSFPKWFKFMVANSDVTAQEIYEGLKSNHLEIIPNWNGRVLRMFHRLFPRAVIGSSRLLVAKSWKQVLGLSPIRKK